jgi:predicted metal-dependent hydrolase
MFTAAFDYTQSKFCLISSLFINRITSLPPGFPHLLFPGGFFFFLRILPQGESRMTDIISLGDIQVEVVYRRIKNLRLTVSPPAGEVRVFAPLNTSRDYIRNFVAAKRSWIAKHRENFRRRAPEEGPENRSAHYVWGQPYRLELTEAPGRPKLSLEPGLMRLQVRPGTDKAKRQAFLDAWRRKLLRETAPALIEKWSARIGVHPAGLYIRKMKSHWGSCNYQRRTIRLNSELVKKNPRCLEYVIVHELIHLIEASHNQNFYRLLNQFMPDWKAIRRGMNTGDL